jgi:hypothetical protein
MNSSVWTRGLLSRAPQMDYSRTAFLSCQRPSLLPASNQDVESQLNVNKASPKPHLVASTDSNFTG